MKAEAQPDASPAPRPSAVGVFHHCAAPEGGDLYIVSGSPLIQECTFYGGWISTDNYGGAISAYSATLLIEDSVFDQNGAVGGAIGLPAPFWMFDAASSRLNIGLSGAAFWCQWGSVLDLTDCTLAYNSRIRSAGSPARRIRLYSRSHNHRVRI